MAWAEPIFAYRGNRFNLVLYSSCVLDVSPMPVVQSSPDCGRTSFSSPKKAICRTPVLESGPHCSGTTAIVPLAASSVPRQIDDSSIQVTSFSTALSLLSLSTDYEPLGSCSRAAGWSAATLCVGPKRRSTMFVQMSHVGGEAEILCSIRALPVLTRSRQGLCSAVLFKNAQNLSLLLLCARRS